MTYIFSEDKPTDAACPTCGHTPITEWHQHNLTEDGVQTKVYPQCKKCAQAEALRVATARELRRQIVTLPPGWMPR